MNKGFYDRQLRKLATPLDEARVQSREQDGKTRLYIEGWYAIAEANAIFGFDGWDREMVYCERLFERSRAESTSCAYAARVRLSVRAREMTIVREGTGFGQASAPFAADAHERALKAAETDATKRALATFGGRFGLMLYDKEHRAQSLAGRDGSARHVGDHGAAVKGAARRNGAEKAPVSGSTGHDTPRSNGEGRDVHLEAASGLPKYRLTGGDGSSCEVGSAESFCSGLRQLIEAATSKTEVEELRRHNEAVIARLHDLPGLKTPRGEHYADILDRLFARRSEELPSPPCDAAGPAARSRATDPDPSSAGARLHEEQPARVDGGAALRPAEAPDVVDSRIGRAEGDTTAPEEDAPRETGLHNGASCTEANLSFGAQVPLCPATVASDTNEAATPAPSLSPSAQPPICLPKGGPGSNGCAAPTSSSSDQHELSRLPNANGGSPKELIPASAVKAERLCSYKPYVPVPPYPLGDIAARLLARPEDGNVSAPPSDAENERVANDAGEPPRRRLDATAPQQPAASSLTRRSQISGGFSVDKSALALPSERRLRSKAHLAMVASKPCLVCEGFPCHAHHVTFAQPRGLSLKVSDEYTVPLCVLHHNELHAGHNEASWWRSQGIEPLVHARALWLVTAGLAPSTEESAAKTPEADSGTAANRGEAG